METVRRQDNTLAIIALVLGILALLLSFVPCAGILAIIPALIGLILGGIAYAKAKDNGQPKTLSLSGLITSGLAILIAVAWMFFIGSAANDIKNEKVEYTDCETLINDYNQIKEEMKELKADMEGDNGTSGKISVFSKITKYGIRISSMKKQSKELGCDINIDEDFDTDGEIEPIENETEEVDSTDF